MIIGNDNSSVRLDFRDTTPQSYRDDLAFSIAVSHNGFCGREGLVWFERAECKRFLAALRDLETKRQGHIQLSSIAANSEYEGFTLELYASDLAGHLALNADLKKVQYITGKAKALRVVVSFELEAERLLNTVAEFEALIDIQK